MTTRFRNSSEMMAAALVLAVTPAISWGQGVNSPGQGAEVRKAEVAKLVAVLESDAATFNKAKACQRLAVVGTKEAVPALAALLGDGKLSTYARFGLEPIPDPSVDDALRNALGKLDGQLLIGVINSIGVRRDVKAANTLTGLVDNRSTEVAAAALAALGQIASPPAVGTLQESLTSDSAELRVAAANAILVSAGRLSAESKREEAAQLCQAIRTADVPPRLRAAALRSEILAEGSAGMPLLLEHLKSNEEEMFRAALRVSRELGGSDVTTSLVDELDRLVAARQALLIRAIGDRRAATALPDLRKRATSGPTEVRAAAIHALGKLEDEAAVAVVLEAAVSGEPSLEQAARASLKSLPQSATGRAILARLDRAGPERRLVLLELVGELSIGSAVPEVRKATHDPDEQVRITAIRTLGKIIALEKLTVLIERLTAPKSPEEEAAVQKALKVACRRMPDAEACVEKLVDYLPDAPVAATCFVMELLGTLGGASALQAVSAAAEDSNEEVRDAATRALGKWMSADAAPELLRLANTLPSEKLRIRTLRGYIRIAQQMPLPEKKKLRMCEEAFRAAERDEERRLVLGVLSHVPAVRAMSLAVPYVSNSTLTKQAAAAVLAIADELVQSEPRAVADAMRKVLESDVSRDQAAHAKKLLQRAGS